jgi:hypothetical protein
MALTHAVEYTAEFSDSGALLDAAAYLAGNENFIKKGKKEKAAQEYPLKDILNSYKTDGNALTLTLYTGKESSVRIDEFLSGITGIEDISGSGVKIFKMAQYTIEDGAMKLLQ